MACRHDINTSSVGLCGPSVEVLDTSLELICHLGSCPLINSRPIWLILSFKINVQEKDCGNPGSVR